MSNLRLINETNVTASVSSVDITDIFSADFDIYKMTVSDMLASSFSRLNCRLINSSGSVISSSSYDYANLNMPASGSYSEIKGSSTYLVNHLGYGQPTSGISNSQGSVSFIFNPFSSSSYSFFLGQSSSNGSNLTSNKAVGVLKLTTSCTGIQILPQLISGTTPTLDTGTIKIYGLRVDS